MSAVPADASSTYLSGGTIIILGPTGAGKSQLGNFLAKQHFFEVGGAMDSETTFTCGRPFNWNGSSYVIFDTPGLDDSDGRDTDIIIEMNEKLHGILDCRGFIYVRNDEQTRMAGSERTVLQHFRDVFGEYFIQNLVIVSTRALPDELLDDEERAQRAKRRTALNNVFCKQLGATREFPKFFIDTSPKRDSAVQQAAHRTADSLMTRLASATPFALGEMKVVASKIDSLEADIEAANLACDEAEAARLAEEKRRLEAEFDREQAEEEAKRQRDRIEQIHKDLAEEKENWESMREEERKEWQRRLEEANKQAKEQSGFWKIVLGIGSALLGGPAAGLLGGLIGAAIDD